MKDIRMLFTEVFGVDPALKATAVIEAECARLLMGGITNGAFAAAGCGCGTVGSLLSERRMNPRETAA